MPTPSWFRPARPPWRGGSGGQLGLEGPFRDLYEQYKDRVYNVCFRISGNTADALDASQETFGILFRKLPDFRFQSKFSSWVYRIAVNASIDLRRRSAAWPHWRAWPRSSPRQRVGPEGSTNSRMSARSCP
ncbi:MAG: sigma-70 family RNA polymerase sigma factor [Planctomycetes bacterium]|nr:sigma-70 family RNA polymerase sigma factor [Planctomycetota bacterium]